MNNDSFEGTDHQLGRLVTLRAPTHTRAASEITVEAILLVTWSGIIVNNGNSEGADPHFGSLLTLRAPIST